MGVIGETGETWDSCKTGRRDTRDKREVRNRRDKKTLCNSCNVLKISANSIVGWFGWVNILLATMYTVWTSCSIVGGTLLATGQDCVWHFHHTSGSLLSCFRYNVDVDGWFLITFHLKIRVKITLLGFCIRIANFGYFANGHCCAILYAQYACSRNGKSGLLFYCRLLVCHWLV